MAPTATGRNNNDNVTNAPMETFTITADDVQGATGTEYYHLKGEALRTAFGIPVPLIARPDMADGAIAEALARIAQSSWSQGMTSADVDAWLEFHAWLESEAPKLLPKHPVRQAMDYALNQWAALIRYVADGRLSIDNLAAERALRGLTIGRRNWLFRGSERGGRAAAIHFSLIASCAARGRTLRLPARHPDAAPGNAAACHT